MNEKRKVEVDLSFETFFPTSALHRDMIRPLQVAGQLINISKLTFSSCWNVITWVILMIDSEQVGIFGKLLIELKLN